MPFQKLTVYKLFSLHSASAAQLFATAGNNTAGFVSTGKGLQGPGLSANCRSEKYRLIIYDTETTGTDPQRLIELAAYAPASDEIFESLVKCPEGIKVGPRWSGKD